MDHRQHGQVVSFIWNIADDVLRGSLNRTKYRDVILPMTVIRRLDPLLEPTKDQVLDTWKLAELWRTPTVEEKYRKSLTGQSDSNRGS